MNRVAAAIFAVGALLFVWIALGSCASGCVHTLWLGVPLVGLAILHAIVALGVLGDRPWARFMGIGLGFYWVLGASLLTESGPDPLAWSLAALHAPLPLLLARPDGVHARTSVSLLLVGFALPLVASLGLIELAWFSTSWTRVAGMLVVVVGAVGLARERTWGLLLVGVGGLFFLGGGLVDPIALEERRFDDASMAALPLVAAVLPFAKPIARFLRG